MKNDAPAIQSERRSCQSRKQQRLDRRSRNECFKLTFSSHLDRKAKDDLRVRIWKRDSEVGSEEPVWMC